MSTFENLNDHGAVSGQTLQSLAWLEKAKYLCDQGNFAESANLFSKVIEMDMYPSEGYFGLGVVYIKNRDFRNALKNLENCIKLDPFNAHAYYYMGEAWEQQGSPESARRYFSKALEINPEHAGALKKRSDLNVHRAPVTPRHENVARKGSDEMNTPVFNLNSKDMINSIKGDSSRLSSTLSSSVYELFRKDSAELSQQIVRAMDALDTAPMTPNLSASLGVFLKIAAAGLFAMWFAVHIAFAVGARAGRPLDLFFLLIAVGGFISLIQIPIKIIKIKCCQFSINNGRLVKSFGVFEKQHENHELIHVTDIKLKQTFINRLTGDGALILTFSSGSRGTITMNGIWKIDRLQQIFPQLRDTVILLRTSPLGKGIIN